MSEGKQVQIPEVLEHEGDRENVLGYLDRLRASGKTNMFGACPYLIRRFGFTEDEASKVLGYWMKTFGQRHKATT